ncbi:hypothetical protein OEA41_010254 [Lepraria neglecta]|uniref:Uncharacterized protein n=1 Tax=Lepraria neglecta TaxID=209136 RepID=A0AAE0DHJ2_9LECA|nr:hypothetical protein OEA41_010254 [Lepraria neglecta]
MADLRSRKVEELSSLSPDKAKSRRLARYDGDTVLIDPKNYGENEDDKLGDKVYDRVQALARMLSNLDFEEFAPSNTKAGTRMPRKTNSTMLINPQQEPSR